MALEMLIGHTAFEEIWLPGYARSILDRDTFAVQLATLVPEARNRIRKAVRNKRIGAAGQEIMFAMLMVQPSKRIAMEDTFTHRWIGGKLKTSKLTSSTQAVQEHKVSAIEHPEEEKKVQLHDPGAET